MGASSRTTTGHSNCIATISGLPAGLLIRILCAYIGAADLWRTLSHAGRTMDLIVQRCQAGTRTGGCAKWFLIGDGVVSTYQRCGNDHQEHTVTPGRHVALLDAMQSIHEQ